MADKSQTKLPPFSAKPRPIKVVAVVGARDDVSVKKAGPKPRFVRLGDGEEAAC